MYRCLAGMLLVLTACGGAGVVDDGRLDVVASLFPLAELARNVGGTDVEVHDLTPADAEAHDLELSGREVDRIEDADIVVYLGGGFQPAVEKAVARAEGRRLDLLPPGTDDPHVWLDPVAMMGFVDKVVEAVGPSSRERGEAYKRLLAALDEEYRSGLAECDRRTLVATHDSFGHLARRYGLEQEALTGLSPEAEPDPKRLAELADLVQAKGVTTVFTEGGKKSPAAEALAREAGVVTGPLYTLEVGTRMSYIEGMRVNLTALSHALGCR